jgi:outer membrane lipoprotein-sorting protein
MRTKIGVMFGLFLVLSLILGGCGNEITAEEIVAKMQETLESTTDAHAVVTAMANMQGIEISATAEVWEKMPSKARAVVLDASEPEYVGTTLVSDGEQAWLYQPDRNVVMVGPMAEIEMPLPQELFTSLQQVVQTVLDASTVELTGEESVAGRETYKLTLSSKEGAELEIFPGDGTATLWVDKEEWIILRATYEASTLGEGSVEVQSFELNSGLPNDLFRFEVPEGAEVVDVEAQQPTFMTLDEAKAQAGFPLLVPDYVPEAATLIQVYEMEGTIVLGYDHSPAVSFTIMQGPRQINPMPSGEEREITIRGQNAILITDEDLGFTFLHWTEDDIVITLAGRISLDEALDVAESLK